jgi:hypothetical protein
MIKKFVLLALFTISTTLFANTLQGETIEETNSQEEVTDNNTNTFNNEISTKLNIHTKVENVLGKEDYNKHINLINYIISKNLSYEEVLDELRINKLLKLNLGGQKYLDLTLVIENSSLKSFKIIKDSFKSLGYYKYLTKKLIIKSSVITWNVELKTEMAIDPTVLVKALKQNNSLVTDIIKEDENIWTYYIDNKNSKLSDVKSLILSDELTLKKALKAYLLEIDTNTNSLDIYSKAGNRWYPKVIFYDNELNILQSIQKDTFHRYLKVYVPYNTKYIKIDDLFSLSNIKRGMKIIKE